MAARTLGIRLNTYTDSLEPARALGPCPPDLNQLASHVIKRHAAVQKHGQFTHPLSIQVEGGCRIVPEGTPRLQFFVEVRVGRMRQILYFVPEEMLFAS